MTVTTGRGAPCRGMVTRRRYPRRTRRIGKATVDRSSACRTVVHIRPGESVTRDASHSADIQPLPGFAQTRRMRADSTRTPRPGPAVRHAGGTPARRRRRAEHPRAAGDLPALRRLRGLRRRRRRLRAAPRPRGRAGPRGARRDAPRHGRVHRHPAAAREGPARPRAVPHRARRHRRQGPGPDRRRRRLRDQAVQPGGGRRPDPRRPAPDPARVSTTTAACCGTPTWSSTRTRTRWSAPGTPIDLSPTEFKLLRYLMLNPGRVLSKSQILDHVWQYDWGGDANIVESYISYLRRKVDQLDDADGRRLPPLIHTKRGVGLPAARVVVTADVDGRGAVEPASTAAVRPAAPARRAARTGGPGTTLVVRGSSASSPCCSPSGLVLAGATSAALLEGTLVGQVDNKLQTEGEELAAEHGAVAQPRLRQQHDAQRLLRARRRSANVDDAEHLAVRGRPVRHPDRPRPDHRAGSRPARASRSRSDSTRAGSSWRAVAYPIYTADGTPAGSIVVALPLGDIERTVRHMSLVLLLSGLGIVLLGAAAGTWAVRRSLKPLREIETTAAAIADGDLSQRVPAASEHTEVGRLSAALNGMLTQIEQAFGAQTASEARMRRFVADASHELRTPLATIRGYGELYRMGALTTTDQVDDTMRRIEQSATRMGALVEDLLALARLDDGRPMRTGPVDLTVLAADAVSDLHALDPVPADPAGPARGRRAGRSVRRRRRGVAAASGAREPRRQRRPAHAARHAGRDRRRAPAVRRGRDRGARPRTRHRPGARRARVRAVLPGRRQPRSGLRRRRPGHGDRRCDRRRAPRLGASRRRHPEAGRPCASRSPVRTTRLRSEGYHGGFLPSE